MAADDLALLLFSSGTTGTPKGVMHSSNTLRFATETYARVQGIGPADTSLVVTAFGFVGSSVLGTYLTYLCGCRTVLLSSRNADDTLDLIARHRATHVLLMPTHAIDVLNSPKLDATDCSSLTRGVLAGLSEAHRLDARKRLCAKPFPMYGMSESPGHCTGWMEHDWERLRTTEGHWLPGTEMLICDDQDRPLPAGEHGNVLLRGPNRFLGYYRADELNRGSLSESGYLRTGDIGFIDAGGFMSFVSRSKDIIRRGGVTITPADVETALRPHPRIADVAVIGLPDARLGERTCACVITRDGADLSLEEVTSFLQSRDFARYQWPESVVRCESFPRTPSLKVQKPELRKQVIARLEGKG
jgi:acyl-CoA synthetase (AMP-forming)/AMP-acid ligase II